MSISDVETAVVQRLYANNQEIAGLGRVTQQAQATAPELGEFPLVSVRVGPMKQPIPIQSFGAGQVIVERDYIIELAVAPRDNTQDTDNLGADALNLTLPWFAIIRSYYFDHPRLQTNAGLAELQYMHEDLLLSDSGTVQMQTPGGVTYLGVVYTLTIAMRGFSSRGS